MGQFFGDGPADETNRSVIAFYREKRDLLLSEATEYTKNFKAIPLIVAKTLVEAETRIAPLLKSNPGDAVSDEELEWLGAWTDRVDQAMEESDKIKESEVLANIRQTYDDTQKFIRKSQAALPEMKEMQRSDFRKSNESHLKQLAFEYATILDSLLVAQSWVADASTTMREISYLGTTLRTQATMHGWKNPNSFMVELQNKRIGKVLRSLEILNKLIAIWQIGDGAKSFLGGGKTTMDTALSGVSFSATIASAGGTLLGASGVFSLYNNLYIGPMVSRIVSKIDELKDLISTRQNRPMIQMGKLDWVDWSIEPGGREMYEYMYQLKTATSTQSLPPMPASVRKYFSKYSDEFDAGTKGIDYDDNPYTPRIDLNYSDLDDKGAWVRMNFEDIWAMLYGNL
ncbi:hypothetical protein [Runella sp.]|uniref:hypothetical protein n=1 Tax=Runella sp. TaxID=1960881 RepID=UPI003D0E4294